MVMLQPQLIHSTKCFGGRGCKACGHGGLGYFGLLGTCADVFVQENADKRREGQVPLFGVLAKRLHLSRGGLEVELRKLGILAHTQNIQKSYIRVKGKM